MKFKFFGILFCLLHFASVCGYAQTPSTQGKEFWISFLKNYEYTNSQINLSLLISAKRTCSGTITNPYTGYTRSFSVMGGGLVTLPISPAECYNNTSGVVAKTALLVKATDTISLFASNYQDRSFDITNVMPASSLLDEYIVQTYHPPYDFYGSEFLIIATENNTIVDITPSVATEDWNLANVMYSKTLQRGEVYQVQTKSAGDEFSGTHIKARDCKKIAVLNGNRLTQVPAGYSAGDHIFEQAMPTAYWGTKFAITNTALRTRDRIKITALKNNTIIRRNGTYVTSINAGRTYELEVLANTENSCFLETSQPVAVYLYLVGVCNNAIGTAEASCCETSCGTGDPSMVWISPIEQKISEITFGTYQTTEIQTHYVNVVVSTTDVPNVTLDGLNISSSFSTLAGNADLSFARVQISHATHTLKCPGGLIAHVYGLGYRESYAYSVGSATSDLQQTIWINDDAFSTELFAVKKVCILDSTKFYTSLNYAYDSIYWHFGDGATSVGDTVYHAYANDGFYTVKMIVKRTTTNCMGVLYDTVTADIKTTTIAPHNTINDTVCKGRYNKYNFSFFAQRDTTIIDTVPTLGCDSIVTLNLKVYPIYDDTIKATICLGQRYNQFGFDTIPTRAGTIIKTQRLQTVHGCDSLSTLVLNVCNTYNDTISAVICNGETYTFDGIVYSSTTFVTQSHNSDCGCDSVVSFDLVVNDTYNKVVNAEIGECDMYQFGDRQITEEGSYTNTFKTVTGCDSIVVLNLKQKQLSEITAFSPFNADGLNDFFMAGYRIQVFNRAGALIYETKTDDQKRMGWNGTNNNGTNVEPGVYYYILYNNKTSNPCIKNAVEVLKK